MDALKSAICTAATLFLLGALLFGLTGCTPPKLPNEGTWECKELDAVVYFSDRPVLSDGQSLETKPWNSYITVDGVQIKVIYGLSPGGDFSLSELGETEWGTLFAQSPSLFEGELVTASDTVFVVEDSSGNEYEFKRIK